MVPTRWAKASISATVRPVISAAHSGVCVGEMGFEIGAEIGVFCHVGAVGEIVAQQDMHDRDGQRAIGAGAQHEAHIGLGHGGGFVDVDDDDLGPALLLGAHGVGHDIDLGMHGIGAPDDDAVALGHLLGIDAAQHAGAGDVAGPGGAGADGVILAGIALGGAQAVDAVAMHMAHGAGIVVGPDGLGAVLGFDLGEAGGDFVEGFVPGDPLRTGRCPWGRCGAADAAAARDDARARRSGRPSRSKSLAQARRVREQPPRRN